MDQNQTPTPPTNPLPPSEVNYPQNPPFAQPVPPQPTQSPPGDLSLFPQNSHKKTTVRFAAIAAGLLLAMAALVGIALLVGHIAKHNASGLQPTPVGGAQCDVSDNYAQIALSGGTDCTAAEAIIKDASHANGADYKSNGYSCKATKASSNSQWADYWTGTFYSYSCGNGGKQVAFNWQPAKPASKTPATPSTSPTTTPTVTVGGPGALQPTVVGGTQCNTGTNYAQVAIGGGAACTDADTVAPAANGSDYTAAGYSCKATKEGANTQWSDYWNNDFYAYTCANGAKQIAFNWQSSSASIAQ